MTQPSQNDPEWIALRARHRQECDAFIARQREFYLRMKAEQAELLARHQQQEGIFWLQPNHVAPSTYNLVPNTPQSTAANVQPTISNLSVSLGDAPYQRPLPTPGPSRKQSFSASSTPSLDVCDSQQQAAQQLKQLHGFAEAQRQSNKQIPTASTKPLQPLKSQPRPNVANTAPSARAALKKQHEIVDLCSDDDDVLVEVTGATYQQKTKPMIAPATFRPSIPTTTPQLPGKGSQKQSPFPISSPLKLEKFDAIHSARSQSQSRLSQLPQNNITLSTQSHDSNQNRNSTAYSALSSTVSQQAAAAVPPHRQSQPHPQWAPTKAQSSFDRKSLDLDSVFHQQVQDSSKHTEDHPAVPVNKDTLVLQQQKQNSGFPDHVLKDELSRDQASALGNTLARKDSDDDVDIEDVPLVLLNISAALKKLGVPTSRDSSMVPDSSTTGVTKRSALDKIAPRTHLPSPSLSTASASTSPAVSEATALLNAFRKPTVPHALSATPDASGGTTGLRALNFTLTSTPEPGKTIPVRRQASVASCTSGVSTPNRKRKQVDLSDDGQSDQSSSEPSVSASRRRSILSLGSPLKKPKSSTLTLTKRHGLPPPSASPRSPAGKKMNSFGSRVKASPTAPSTPEISPRPSAPRPRLTTPSILTQSSADKRAKALATPPNKRKAAIRARSELQKISEADEEFLAEDRILQASTGEACKAGTSSAELGTRLRGMSITPGPEGFRSSTSAGSEMRDAPTRVSNDGGGSSGQKSSKDSFTKSRFTARNHNIRKSVKTDSDGEYVEDLDTSEFTFVNGIILQKGQEGRLNEIQTKATSFGIG